MILFNIHKLHVTTNNSFIAVMPSTADDICISDEIEDSSILEASSMDSDDIWINPLSDDEKHLHSSSYDQSSYESTETSEYTDDTGSSNYTNSEDDSSRCSVDSSENRHFISQGNLDGTADVVDTEEYGEVKKDHNGEEKEEEGEGEIEKDTRNLAYLFGLMNEEVPQELHATVVEEKKNEVVDPNAMFGCSRCEKDVKYQNTVLFIPCKHRYCVNCVLNSNENGVTRLFQCLIAKCNSTCSTQKLEEEHPVFYASYMKYSTIGRAQQTNHSSRPFAASVFVESTKMMEEQVPNPLKVSKSNPDMYESESVEEYLVNAMSVACPKCDSPVSIDPDIAICDHCKFKFCFACLAPLRLSDIASHICVASKDDALSESSQEISLGASSNNSNPKKRSLFGRICHTLSLPIRLIVNLRRHSKSHPKNTQEEPL